MSITQGASVQFDDNTFVTLSGEAALVVDGMGTTLDFSGDMVDLVGSGGVAVTNGGHVTASDVDIGTYSNSDVSLRVEGNGSRWTSTGTMSLGYSSPDPMFENDGIGRLAVYSGGTLDVGQQLYVEVGEVELDDATVIFHRPDALPTGAFTYVSGTIQFDTDLTIADSGETVNILFGASPLIPADKQLAVTGTATLQTTTTIDGGTLSVGSLAGPEYLQFNTGTFNLTGDNLTVGPDGLFGTQLTVEAQQTINVANTVSVNPGGSLTVETGGSFSSGQLANFGTVEFDSLHVGGDDSAAGRTGTLTVGLGGTVNVANTLKIWDDGTVNLNGGTINTAALVFAGSTLNFNAGKLHFTSDPGLDAALLAKIFGPAPTVSGDQHLSVAGLTVLLEPLILDGGTFSVGTLVNPASLQFNTGTLNLTEDDLKIGLGGLFGHTLEVTDDQTIQVSHDAQVYPTGLLLISGGAFSANWISNYGEVRLGGGNSLLAGGSLYNTGVVAGDGRISAPLTNIGGLVSVGPGQRLLLTGSGNRSEGTITTTGGEIQLSQGLTNGPMECPGQINIVDGTFYAGGIVLNDEDGYISGQGNVTLRFGYELINYGTLGFSAAEASVHGNINNRVGGLIAVAGQSTATFVGGLENNGDVYVGEGSSAVFLSRVSGGGDFSGGGPVEFVDGYELGPGPKSVYFAGNVLFGSAATLEIELAGTSAQDPVEFDQLVIAEDLTLSGALDVLLIDGFMPELGDEFLIVTFGSVAGDFDTYSGLDLGGGLWLEPSFTSHGLVLTTVPEPSTPLMLTALGAGLLAIAARRRWRRRVA